MDQTTKPESNAFALQSVITIWYLELMLKSTLHVLNIEPHHHGFQLFIVLIFFHFLVISVCKKKPFAKVIENNTQQLHYIYNFSK